MRQHPADDLPAPRTPYIHRKTCYSLFLLDTALFSAALVLDQRYGREVWPLSLVIFLVNLPALPIACLLASPGDHWHLIPSIAENAAIVVVASLSWAFIVGRELRRKEERCLRALWSESLICPRCGYDLRATPTRCPECGLVISQSTSRSEQ